MPLTDEQERRVARELEVYDENLGAYEANARELKKRLKSALKRDERIHLHAVDVRVKKRRDLLRKLRKKVQTDPILHVEDIIGVRVITYYRDDAVWVEQTLQDLLQVHPGSYVNKADMLDDTEFGYRSIQFVVTMPWVSRDANRMPELMRKMVQVPSLSPAVAEVQIRSILEHAWAETEHGLQYHGASMLSRGLRRRFALTAALVENVDEQLIAIRDGILLDRARDTGTTDVIEMNLQRIIETDRASRALDTRIADALDLPLVKAPKHQREVERAVLAAGLRTDHQIRAALAEQDGDLGLRMAIVCVDVDHPLILPDARHHEIDEPIAAFPGIGIYWTALALLHRHRDPVWSFDSVSEGRLAEYTDVGEHLMEHREQSALSVRERYRAQANPPGEYSEVTHILDLGP
jgi:ppGpp synthetase/RelA/SpoT-type nucleotidyltranferase